MSDEAKREWAAAGEMTGKIKQVIAKETSGPLSSVAKRLRGVRFVLGLVVVLIGGGFGTAFFARAKDVAELHKKLDQQGEQIGQQNTRIEAHIAAETERDRSVASQATQIEHHLEMHDRHFESMERQLLDIAIATGARQRPLLPSHKATPQEDP